MAHPDRRGRLYACSAMLRISDTTRANLEAGRVVTAIVWPAGEEHPAPATLEWSFESGATVRLVEPTDQWKLPFNAGHHVVHLAVNGGEEYTMLDARVNGMSADGRIAKLGAYTLALGAHTDTMLAGGGVFDGNPHGVVWREWHRRHLSRHS